MSGRPSDLAPVMCRREGQAGERVLDACEECGHTLLVHPGPSNPALSFCALCEMAAVVLLAELGAGA